MRGTTLRNESEEMSYLIDLVILTLAVLDCVGFVNRRNCLILNNLQVKGDWLIIAKEGSRFSRFTVYLLWERIKTWKRRKTEVDTNCSTRLSVPCFPDWIFDLLPEMLRQGLSIAEKLRKPM